MFIAKPIGMVSSPNNFWVLEDNRWEITDPNSQTLWFMLEKSDGLGQRRYIPTAGSTVSVIFQRADEFAVNANQFGRLQNQVRTITKNATAAAQDGSLFSFSMTSADISAVVSGTVKFELTESGVPTVWLQNYFLRKNLTSPGF